MATFPRTREKIRLSCTKCDTQPPDLDLRPEDPRPLHRCGGRAAIFDVEQRVGDLPKPLPRFAI